MVNPGRSISAPRHRRVASAFPKLSSPTPPRRTQKTRPNTFPRASYPNRDSSNTTAGKILVVVRLRPQNQLEIQQNGFACVQIHEDKKTVTLLSEGIPYGLATNCSFMFDHAFDVDSEQEGVYTIVGRPLVLDLINGYNCSLLAYGQTGSGKTHCMMGDINSNNSRGITPRIADDIFDCMTNSSDNLEYMVKASFIEMHLEAINDLLGNHDSIGKVKLREDLTRGVYIEGAVETYVSNREELMLLIQKGSANRVIASTRMNADSSRSHSVFIISVEQKNISTGMKKIGRMYLVDLAGSEILSKTGAQGQTLQEAKMINKSLSALGNVIKALTEGSSHIPYRDSKLTRILQDSLGGNSKTALVITCSCSSYNIQETLSTIRFGQRAKNVENRPQVNQEISISQYKKLLLQASSRETELKRLLEIMTLELEMMKIELGSKSLQLCDTNPEPNSASTAGKSCCDSNFAPKVDFFKKLEEVFDESMNHFSSEKTASPNTELLEEKEIELMQYKEQNTRLQEEIDKLNATISESARKELELQQKVADLTLLLETKALAEYNQDRKHICEQIHADALAVMDEGNTFDKSFAAMVSRQLSASPPTVEVETSDAVEISNGLESSVPEVDENTKSDREKELEKDFSLLMAQNMHLREEMERLKDSMSAFKEVVEMQCKKKFCENCTHLSLLKEALLENEELKMSIQHKSQKLQQLLIKFSNSIRMNSRLEAVLERKDNMIQTLETTLQQMQRDIRKTLELHQDQDEKLRKELEAYRTLYTWMPTRYGKDPAHHLCLECLKQGTFANKDTITAADLAEPCGAKTEPSSSFADVIVDGFYNRIIKPIQGRRSSVQVMSYIDAGSSTDANEANISEITAIGTPPQSKKISKNKKLGIKRSLLSKKYSK